MKRKYCITFVHKDTKEVTRTIDYFGTYRKACNYAALCCSFNEFVASLACDF